MAATMHYSGVHCISTGKVEQQRHVDSIAFMQRIMGTAPKPRLRPDVAQRAYKARVVFGD